MQFNRPLATVTPTLDGDVLGVLASHDVSFTTGQIHRVLNDYSEQGIRKVLTRLVIQGVVSAERIGNAFAYRLNTEHLAAEPIQALARLGSTFMSRLERHLQAFEQPPAYAAVFGSAARGEMSLHSDIDILLVSPQDADADVWARQVNELAPTIARWTGNDARIVEYTEEALRAAGTEPMVRDVIDHGLTVAGTRAWLLKQLKPPIRKVRRK